MKICRFNGGRLGVVQDAQVYDVTHVLQLLPAQRYPLPQHDLLVASLPSLLAPLRAATAGALRHAIAAVRSDTPI